MIAGQRSGLVLETLEENARRSVSFCSVQLSLVPTVKGFARCGTLKSGPFLKFFAQALINQYVFLTAPLIAAAPL